MRQKTAKIPSDLYFRLAQLSESTNETIDELASRLLSAALGERLEAQIDQIRNEPFRLDAKTISMKRCVGDLSNSVRDEQLLGTNPFSNDASITISGIAAIGLLSVGEERAARSLIETIKNHQIRLGADRGGFFVPGRLDSLRPSHNWANLWGMHSILLVDPQGTNSEELRAAISYFLRQQNQGAWSLSRVHSPKVYYTAHIMLVLLEFVRRGAEDVRLLEQVEASIQDAARFILGSKTGEALLWRELSRSKSGEFHFPTTLLAVRALNEYRAIYGQSDLFGDYEIEDTIYGKIKASVDDLLHVETVEAWPRTQDNESPTFHTWLSVPDIAHHLLALGVSPWDSSIIASLQWVEANIVEEQGISGVSAGPVSDGQIVNWATGHALRAISDWEAFIMQTLLAPGFLAQIVGKNDTTQLISSSHYVDAIVDMGRKSSLWKNRAVVATFISATLGMAILIQVVIENAILLDDRTELLFRWINSVVVNPVVAFAFGLLGVLPLLFTVVRAITKLVSQWSESDRE